MGVRKCSKCGKTGHNSRTCRNLSSRNENCGKSMKLFGVEFRKLPSSDDGSGFKSLSLSFSPTEISSSDEDTDKLKRIGPTQGQRKKGIPWTEEEHKLFLIGLEKLGKGNWRGISRNFVTTRTSTQVASHAQKYFIRLNNASKNKFDHTILSMMRRNEAQCCIYSIKKPNNSPLNSPEVAYNFRLFHNSATQSLPSLELSLAAPPLPPPLVWDRRPRVVLWEKQYVVKNIQPI